MRRSPITMFFSFIFAVFSILSVSLSEAAVMTDYCSIPPFVSTSVPPNVMIMLSIETPMQGAMHPDQTCTGNPATDESTLWLFTFSL